MQKQKNLFTLPTTVSFLILPSIMSADVLATDYVTYGYIAKSRAVTAFFQLIISFVNTYLRYVEDEQVYTPKGFPGRDCQS